MRKLNKKKKNSSVNATVTVEQVERRRTEVRIPENEEHYGVIRVTTTTPPHKPELRLSFTPFEKQNKRDKRYSKNSYTSSYILTTHESAQLLCASFREAAKMIEKSSQTLPNRSAVIASISKE